MNTHRLLEGLNDKQREAVLAVDGPVLVVAGAGSGKTKALTHRIAYMIEEKEISPWNILAVTFTNKAAGEMRTRLHNLLGARPIEEMNEAYWANFFVGRESAMPMMGTFHSICVRILRKYAHFIGFENSFVIFDPADQNVLARNIYDELNIDPKKFPIRAVLSRVSNAKNELVSPQAYSEKVAPYNVFEETVARFYHKYQKELARNKAMDFDDLIMKTVELLRHIDEVRDALQEKFRYISVDEYQDTNFAQYTLVSLLAAKYRNLCVIGDSDQSIYSWRGADIRNILDFEKDYYDAKVVMLEQNYRSTKMILDASNEIISLNKNRRSKTLWTDKVSGEKLKIVVAENEREEAALIAKEIQKTMQTHEHKDYRDFAVLYRTNAQSRIIEEAFLRYGLPYKIVGGVKFYERKEVKDILAYLKLIHNSSDDISFLRIVNVPTRNIGSKTIEALQKLAQWRNCSLSEALAKARDLANPEIQATIGASLTEVKIEKLLKFHEILMNLSAINRQFPASGLIKHVIDFTGYKEFLDPATVEGQSRIENLQELISVAGKYDALDPGISTSIFLEEVALISDVDQIEDQDNAVTLMTVHAAKGLEFTNVFIAGMEEGVFPHSRCMFNPHEMEEERRLLYVAMTRAMERLYLLHAKQRMLYGEFKNNSPSQFLRHISAEFVDGEHPYAKKKSSFLRGDDFNFVPLPDESPASEVVFENEFVDQVELFAGDKVMHDKFGKGEVLEISGGVATIKFEAMRYGTKKLAISIAPLRKIDG
jgi:DNA helicase-2/ATP-dependent DNA helicase PcrA